MFRSHFHATIAVIGLLIMTAIALGASAAELRLTLANDPVSGNERKDDLYTSETALELRFTERRAIFTERMFTNREGGYRFDETRFSMTLAPSTHYGWDTVMEVGVLHVGKGLLGESVQNSVHRAVGSEEVHLAYIENQSFHPTAALDLRRRVATLAAMPVHLDVHVETAPAFRSTLATRFGLSRQFHRGVEVEAGIGIRGDYVESRWLDDVVDTAGVMGDVTISWRGVALSLSHNRYGTASNHVTLGWRAPLGR